MSDSIFTCIQVDPTKDIHVFKNMWDYTSTESIPRIIIDIDSVNNDIITLQYRLRYLYMTGGERNILSVLNSSGNIVSGWDANILPVITGETGFALFYGKSKDANDQSEKNPGYDWFNITVTVNKVTGYCTYRFTRDDNTLIFEATSSKSNTTRDNTNTERWCLGIISVPYSRGHMYELDLSSVKVTLDGTIHKLKDTENKGGMGNVINLKGFTLDSQNTTHTFVSDGSLVSNPEEAILIKPTLSTHPQMLVTFKIKYIRSEYFGHYGYKAVIAASDNQGNIENTYHSTIIPSIECTKGFNVQYPNWIVNEQGITSAGYFSESGYFTTIIFIDKTEGCTYLTCSSSVSTWRCGKYPSGKEILKNNTTADNTTCYSIGAYALDGSGAPNYPYSIEVDLNSVEVVLDGKLYNIKDTGIQIDHKIVLNNTEGEFLEPYVTVDSSFNTESTNPIQNNLVANRLRDILYFDEV